MANHKRLHVHWTRYDADGLITVSVETQTVTEEGVILASYDTQTLSFPEADAIAKGVENGRIDFEWGNTEIEQIVLASEITGLKVIKGFPAIPAVVNPATGEIIREAIEEIPDTYLTEGPRFPDVTEVTWV